MPSPFGAAIHPRSMRWGALVAVALGACGRDEPRLFAVVDSGGDAPDDCLPLRMPDLSGLDRRQADRLRLPVDHYFWLVGEAMESPRGFAGALASLTGRPALVSVTSAAGGLTTTRAAAAIEGGHVAHTWFGTPLTPAFPFEDGLQLALTFEAQQLDGPAYQAAKAVLESVTLETAAYSKLMDAVSPREAAKSRATSETWVLRDPRSCPSGACSAVIAEERLVMLAAAADRPAQDLAAGLCLKGSRLLERKGREEHGGSYAVLRVAHARLPEEALGSALADALAALARCDHEFAPELASRASDALSRAATLRVADREAIAMLLDDAAFAVRASGAESRLEAERRLARSSAELCRRTPADGIACSRAKAMAACASTRASAAAPLRAAWTAALASTDAAERLASAAGTCDERGPAAVALGRDLGTLAAAARTLPSAGACQATETGLACEAFPELSRRSRAAVSGLQEAIYRGCHCPALQQDADSAPVSRLVRAALACAGTPEELSLQVPADLAVSDSDVAAWRAHFQKAFPAYTAAQCPACGRLARRVDDELARAVALGRQRAAVAGLLQRALAPVNDLHDRAFMLLSGEAAVRCAGLPAQWSVIARALDFTVAPRDVFGPGGDLDPARLDARLREADALALALGDLPCARVPAPAVPDGGEEPAGGAR